MSAIHFSRWEWLPRCVHLGPRYPSPHQWRLRRRQLRSKARSTTGCRSTSLRRRSRWSRLRAGLSSRGFNANPDAPTLIGSMSKAVTGACIATLIGEGKLSFTTPMKDAMPGYFRNFGPPADTRLMDVTVEQLLAHRSGLPGNSDGDPIHGIFRKRAEAGLGGDASPGPLLQEHFRRKLDRRFPTATRTTSRLPR